MNIDPNAPAFPVVHTIIPQPGHFTQTPPAQPGLTIRAEIASRIMAGLVANSATERATADQLLNLYPANAVALADALIAELNK